MSSTSPSPERAWRWRIFAATWLAYAGFYVCRKNFSVVMPMMSTDLGYTKDDFAIILTAYSLMYAIGQFYSGYLSDRFGPRVVVGTGLLISLTVNAAMGFGASIALFFLMNTLNGAAQSIGWSGTVKNMGSWFRHDERGVVMGFWGTCYVVGGSAASAFATFCATNTLFFEDWGWRRGFHFPALLLFIMALIYIFGTRNKPSDVGLPDLGGEDAGAEEGVHTPVTGIAAYLSLLREPTIWIVGGMYFFLKLTRYAFLFWLPLYMTEALAYTPKQAGYMSTIYELIGFLGVIFAGFVSDKLFQSRRFPVSALMLYGLAFTCYLYPIFSPMGFLMNAVGIGLIGMMTFGPDALMSGPAAMDIGGKHATASAAGIINGIGSLGQTVSPLVVAWISTQYGWDALFHTFVVMAIVSGTLLLSRWNYGRVDHHPPARA